MHRCHCLQKFRNVAAFESTLNSTIVSYRVALKSVINVLFVRCQRVRLSACVGMCWNVGDSIMKACVNGKIELRYGLLTTDYSLSLSLFDTHGMDTSLNASANQSRWMFGQSGMYALRCVSFAATYRHLFRPVAYYI